jgi:chromosome segregation ATPase
MANSIEKRKATIKEISSSLESREKQVSDLEGKYSSAMDARMNLENIEGLDEETKEHFRELSKSELEKLQEEGEELSDEMISETNKLDGVREENAQAMEANNKASDYAQSFDVATGGNTASAIDQKTGDISAVADEINSVQKEINDLSNRAKHLYSKRGGDSF